MSTIKQITGKVTNASQLDGNTSIEVQRNGQTVTQDCSLGILAQAVATILGLSGDTTAPTLVSIRVENATPNRLDYLFNEVLNGSSIPATSAFTVSGGKTVTGVAITGSTVQVTVNSPYAFGDVITAGYTVPGSNQIKDTSGNNAAAISGSTSVTNDIDSGFDTDAEAFFTATGITDTTQKNAVNALVVGLKTDGLWTKMHAVYPFVGGTATTHKFNLKNPLDTDAAYRLTFAGTVTHNANGITPDGTTGYADTKFNPSNTGHLASLGSSSLGFYSKTQNNGGGSGGTFANIGSYSDSSGTRAFWIASAWAADLVQSQLGVSVVLNTTDADTQAFFVATRRSTTDAELYLDGTSANTNVSTETLTAPNHSVYIGALNYNGTASFFAPHNIAFAFMGDGLTDTEVGNLNTRVVTFQTALSRQN
jgi:hypothetical protein